MTDEGTTEQQWPTSRPVYSAIRWVSDSENPPSLGERDDRWTDRTGVEWVHDGTGWARAWEDSNAALVSRLRDYYDNRTDCPGEPEGQWEDA